MNVKMKLIGEMCGCFLPAIILAGCVNGTSASADRGRQTVRQERTELPLPTLPPHLVSPADRAAYLAEHYWDSLDFRTGPERLDTAFMEQGFVNYAAVLAMVEDHSVIESAIGSLLRRAKESDDGLALLEYVAEKYLDDPNSPVRNEDLYIMFLQRQLADTAQPAYRMERLRYRLDSAMKNRPGMVATDFRMVVAGVGPTTLLQSLGEGETLLMFYDPNCEQCEEMKERLVEEVPRDGISVVAVDVTGDRDRWERTKGGMPTGWTVAFATDPVEDDELYILRALPTLYLISADGRILLKDFLP